MSCRFNGHIQTSKATGLPVAAPAAGATCDCGETIATYDSGTGAMTWQYTPTGRLQGR